MVATYKLFGILMWRKYKIRMRGWYYIFPLEIVIPSFFFAMLFILRSYVDGDIDTRRSNKEINVQQSDPFSLDRPQHDKLLIMYTPDSPLAHTLMDEVGAKLNLKRLGEFDHNAQGYYAFPNGTLDLSNDFIDNMRETTAVVIFNDLEDATTWPKNFNYTIRMKTDFMIHVYQSLDDQVMPHARFGQMYEPFMRLQWAIDSSYLKLLTGNEINQTVTLQEIPFVDTRTYKEAKVFCQILMSASYMSLLMVFIYAVSTLITDHKTGIFELIKMTGVSRTLYSLADFTNLLPMGLWYSLSGALFSTVSSTPMLRHTSPLLIFIVLFLYFVSIVSMAFAVSYIFGSTGHTIMISSLVYIATSLHSYVNVEKVPRTVVYLICLLPHAPIASFWEGEVEALESYDKGLTFANMAHTNRHVSALLVCVFMALQSVLWFILTWYLSIVRPGEYGVAKPWNFCFLQLKKPKQISPEDLVDEEVEPMTRDPQYFEPPPPRHDAGISIAGVTKIFGKQAALNNMSLDVYRGEITILLGHNGAGKTTLMSIITGMFSPSSGSVYVNGENVTESASVGSGRLGFCPQKSIVIPQLTAKQHAIFFGLLKGQTMTEANKSAMDILAQVGLDEKAHYLAKSLSGGQLRRLQLVIALAGGADVLVLDEPTSGLDVETRRELWDLLLGLRGSRTILLSTHFMEEADALGDRVAALHAGELRCHATPMFLKKSIGTGYRLSLTTVGAPKEEAITSLVSSIVPEALLKEQTYNSVTYSLPAQYNSQFSQLFAELESRRPELGIDSIGVGLSTLEEVFLKLCSDTTAPMGDELTDDATEVMPTYRRKGGISLVLQQCAVLVKRQIIYILTHKTSFLLLEVLMPLALLVAMSFSMNSAASQGADSKLSVKMDFNIFRFNDKRVMYRVDGQQAKEALRTVAARHRGVRFMEVTDDVAQAVLREGKRDMHLLNNYLVGVELNDTDAHVLYTTVVRHAAPVGINLLSNLLAAQLLPWSDGATITTENSPLRSDRLGTRRQSDAAGLNEPINLISAVMWICVLLLIMMSAISHILSLLKLETAHGSRHLHLMAGCPALVHYAVTLLFHSAVYSVLLAVPATFCLFIDKTGTLTQSAFMSSFFFICVLGIVDYIAFCYIWQMMGLGAFLNFVYIMIFGMASAFVKTLAEVTDQPLGLWGVPLTFLKYVSPAHTFVAAAIKSTHAAISNGLCTLNRDAFDWFCPAMMVTAGKDFDAVACCEDRTNPVPYFSFSKGAGREVLILLAQIVAWTVFSALSGRGILSSVGAAISRGLADSAGKEPMTDEMVRAEATYIDKAVTLPSNQIQEVLLVHELRKSFFRFRHPKTPVNVIKGISFSVKKGECFGVLGVNGAGKTTTFKVIAGLYCPDSGQLFANGYFSNKRNQYLHSLSYCPQFFGLDEFLTGRQTLELLLKLRGFDPDTVRREITTWIKVVGLQKALDKRVKGYSGGMARRLSTAAALCTGTPLALLDEPTSGVDVGARRRVWAAMKRGLRQQRSIIITSHSMDEMEALCSRIAILVDGRVAALGSAAQLRAQHAQGHAVVVKLHPAAQAQDDSTESLQNLKADFKEKFNCSLKDEHKTMLHYHINETMRYSDLFAALEELKAKHKHFVEDYSVTETTLEEVFLSFAQHSSQRPADSQV